MTCILVQAPGELPSLSFAVPVAAGLAGVVLSFVLSPFELVKVTSHACLSSDMPKFCYRLLVRAVD